MLTYLLFAVLCVSSAVKAAPGYLNGGELLAGHGPLLTGPALHAPAYYGHSAGLAYAPAPAIAKYSYAAPITKYAAAPAISYAAPAITKYAAAPAISYAAPSIKYAAAPLSLGYKSYAPALPLDYGHAAYGHASYGHSGYGQLAISHAPALSYAHAPALAYGHDAGLAHAW